MWECGPLISALLRPTSGFSAQSEPSVNPGDPEATEVSPDPGDQALLEWAVREERVIVTIDSDFGLLVFFQKQSSTSLFDMIALVARRARNPGRSP